MRELAWKRRLDYERQQMEEQLRLEDQRIKDEEEQKIKLENTPLKKALRDIVDRKKKEIEKLYSDESWDELNKEGEGGDDGFVLNDEPDDHVIDEFLDYDPADFNSPVITGSSIEQVNLDFPLMGIDIKYPTNIVPQFELPQNISKELMEGVNN